MNITFRECMKMNSIVIFLLTEETVVGLFVRADDSFFILNCFFISVLLQLELMGMFLVARKFDFIKRKVTQSLNKATGQRCFRAY